MAAVILAWRIAISTIECSGNYGGCALGTLESCVTKNGVISKSLGCYQCLCTILVVGYCIFKTGHLLVCSVLSICDACWSIGFGSFVIF